MLIVQLSSKIRAICIDVYGRGVKKGYLSDGGGCFLWRKLLDEGGLMVDQPAENFDKGLFILGRGSLGGY